MICLDDLIYQPSLAPEFDGVLVAVTRTGLSDSSLKHPLVGASPQGFNLGLHTGDVQNEVLARRQAVCAFMGAPVCWLRQVHGCDVFYPMPDTATDLDAGTADASVSTQAGQALAILTADCLPAVFVARNQQGKACGVAAAHAGWRGLQAGVLNIAAQALARRANVSVADVSVWLGPAIGPASFEVGAEVMQAFADVFPAYATFFTPVQNKYLGNLYAIATFGLKRLGVRHIVGGGFDTFTDSQWFSYRRAAHQGQQAGRQATLVRLLP